MSSSYQNLTSEEFPALPVDALDIVDESDRRILVVDDEDSVRNMFADYLSEKYECTTASSSDEALAHLNIDSYAVVISDMTMPGRNGVELLREIITRYQDTMVIMVSGVDRPQRIRDAMRVGAFDYLIKPCELDVLSFSVERALEKRSLARTARKYKADLERQNAELASRKAELERLQAQLVQSEKMASLGQLAAGIAHELNNPAGFIFGNMDLLKGYVQGLTELLREYDELTFDQGMAERIQVVKDRVHYAELMLDLDSIIADCREGAVRIRDVVQNLRLFSRLDESEFKRSDLHEGLDSTIRLLSRYYGSGNVRLVRNYGALPMVSCYAAQMNQVWMNLLVNAAQAVGDHGEVRIATEADAETVSIEISDSGCGIPAEQMNRIFDPFFTTKAVGEGTGLGLSISYGIIERHGGTIYAESKVGEGTRFVVRIPVEASTHKESSNTSNLPV